MRKLNHSLRAGSIPPSESKLSDLMDWGKEKLKFNGIIMTKIFQNVVKMDIFQLCHFQVNITMLSKPFKLWIEIKCSRSPVPCGIQIN